MFIFFAGTVCFAEGEDAAAAESVSESEETEESSGSSSKAIAAAACIAVVASVGAISMGFAISKSADGISRQPEADGKIRTTLMLGLVFIETAIIYALIVAILIIFVL
ncbi:MAG: ATP synthase F0 subunit C [Clostridia bacterium]|nr:ATP synthase F0 subunit C [Clostridia bacterium]